MAAFLDAYEAAQKAMANGGPAPAVHSFVRKWRTGQDETANSYVIEISL